MFLFVFFFKPGNGGGTQRDKAGRSCSFGFD